MKQYIPISKVKTRMENLELFPMKKNKSLNIYPLDETYNDIYDFKNLKSAILNWNYFSESITTNINKVCSILKIIKNNGTNQELQEATNIIITEIIPYLKNPTEFKYNFNKLNESMPEITEQIINSLSEQAECDRVIYNKDLISKRFNIKKVFSSILNENNFVDTIYNFCDLVDTYDMPLKSKYCIANEISLLFIKDYFSFFPVQLIEENIIDYFITHHGTNDIPKFIDTIQDAINKDKFISENATEYLKYIEKIYNNIDGTDYEKEVLNHFNENVGISFVLNYTYYNKNLKESYKNVLSEMRLFDKTKDHVRDLLTKFKISPVKTVGMAKETLKSSFDSVPAEYAGKAVKTVLKISFFLLITLSAFTLGLIAIILAFIAKLIYDRYFSDKGKLEEAIKAMREHQEELERKIKTEAVLSKKERMQEYSEALENEIHSLENEYKEIEDREKMKYGQIISDSANTLISYNIKRDVFDYNI